MTLTTFDILTDTITYPDGTKETLHNYQRRKTQFEYIRGLQKALEKLKVLYQNPGAMNPGEYDDAINHIKTEFANWENLLFIECHDSVELEAPELLF